MPARTKTRSCVGKDHAHANRVGALAHIRSLVAARGARFSAYRAYECKHCGAWHVGHRRSRKRKQR